MSRDLTEHFWAKVKKVSPTINRPACPDHLLSPFVRKAETAMAAAELAALLDGGAQ